MAPKFEGTKPKSSCSRKRKLLWMQGPQGAIKMQRAIEHRQRLEDQGDFGLLEDHEKNTPDWLTQYEDIKDASCLRDMYVYEDKMVASRILSYLLQLMIFLLRGWTGPPLKWKMKFGMGHDTAPRRAIAWHHEYMMSEDHVRRCTSVERLLFMRAIKDKDKAGEILAQFDRPEDISPSAAGTTVEGGASSSSAGEPAPHVTLSKQVLKKLHLAAFAGHFPWPPVFKFNVDTLWNEFGSGDTWKVPFILDTNNIATLRFALIMGVIDFSHFVPTHSG